MKRAKTYSDLLEQSRSLHDQIKFVKDPRVRLILQERVRKLRSQAEEKRRDLSKVSSLKVLTGGGNAEN